MLRHRGSGHKIQSLPPFEEQGCGETSELDRKPADGSREARLQTLPQEPRELAVRAVRGRGALGGDPDRLEREGVRLELDPLMDGGRHGPEGPQLFLLHGGLLHLVGNMLYLWIFGDNVEDALGHGRYILFYIVCGTAAAFAQSLANPESVVPMIGARRENMVNQYTALWKDLSVTVRSVVRGILLVLHEGADQG